jgi:hypothetical protein
VQPGKPRVHGNPSVLKSKSIWFAGTKSSAIPLGVFGVILLTYLIMLHLPPYAPFLRQIYALAIALILTSLIFIGNNYFYHGSSLELDRASYKFNSLREYKSRISVDIPGKALPIPEKLVKALTPNLPVCRATAFRDRVIVIGNDGTGASLDPVKRAYMFINPIEGGICVHVVMYPLLFSNNMYGTLFGKPTLYPDPYDLKLLVRVILPVLSDLPSVEAKVHDTIKLD